jgi:hypothetical protein
MRAEFHPPVSKKRFFSRPAEIATRKAKTRAASGPVFNFSPLFWAFYQVQSLANEVNQGKLSVGKVPQIGPNAWICAIFKKNTAFKLREIYLSKPPAGINYKGNGIVAATRVVKPCPLITTPPTMKLVPTLLLITAMTGVASAASIVQTNTITPYTAGGTRTATFDQFDTLGGTRVLTGITVEFSFDKVGGSYSIDNDSTESGAVVFNHLLRGRLTSSDVSVGTNGTFVDALSEFETTVGADDLDEQNVFNTGGPDYILYAPTDIFGIGNSSSITSPNWAAYTGTGNFDINFVASQLFSVDGVGGLQSLTIASTVAPTVIVTYNYTTVVPEPTSILMGSLGALVLLGRKRRR